MTWTGTVPQMTGTRRRPDAAARFGADSVLPASFFVPPGEAA